jgi:hypothetical protein
MCVINFFSLVDDEFLEEFQIKVTILRLLIVFQIGVLKISL